MSIYGTKTIGFLGSICLLYNNLTGSGLVLFSSLYQSSGILPVTLSIIFMTILTIICSIMLFECMSAVPCNEQFQRRIEYTTICRYYLKPSYYTISQIFYQLSFIIINVTTIIQSIQVTDYAINDIFTKTCALQFIPSIDAYCVTSRTPTPTPTSLTSSSLKQQHYHHQY